MSSSHFKRKQTLRTDGSAKRPSVRDRLAESTKTTNPLLLLLDDLIERIEELPDLLRPVVHVRRDPPDGTCQPLLIAPSAISDICVAHLSFQPPDDHGEFEDEIQEVLPATIGLSISAVLPSPPPPP